MARVSKCRHKWHFFYSGPQTCSHVTLRSKVLTLNRILILLYFPFSYETSTKRFCTDTLLQFYRQGLQLFGGFRYEWWNKYIWFCEGKLFFHQQIEGHFRFVCFQTISSLINSAIIFIMISHEYRHVQAMSVGNELVKSMY